jgi:hypothetical protein
MAGICVPLLAQESAAEVRRHAYVNPFDQGNETLINLLNRQDKGDEYRMLLLSEWRPLHAEGYDSMTLDVDSANFHLGQNRIYFIYGGKLFSLYPDKTRNAILDGRKFERFLYKTDRGTLQSAYFEIVEPGEYTLLCRHDIRVVEKNAHPMGLEATRSVEYRQIQNYDYLRQGVQYPEPVPLKKSAFIMIFRKNRPQIAAFAKEHRISLRSRDDILSTFRYYNELTTR